MSTGELRGIFQIVHTAFFENGEIDYDSIARQVEFCRTGGVHGLVMPANASEFFTLTDDERFRLVENLCTRADPAMPVVVGVQAPTTKAAVTFAEHARQHGAAAVMAMPPYLRKAGGSVLKEYYRQIADVGLDVIIQNAPGPIGTPLAPSLVQELLSEHSNVSYLKEEVPPILQRISFAVENGGEHCRGVFGGANGLVIVEELDRGACGNMPAGGVIDVQVESYNAYQNGNRALAVDIQQRLMPLLFHASTYGVMFHKYILWKRGVITTPTARDPQAIHLDAHDRNIIHERWKEIAGFANSDYPLGG